MYDKYNELNIRQFLDVPDYYKSKKMCKRVVLEEPMLLEFVPD